MYVGNEDDWRNLAEHMDRRRRQLGLTWKKVAAGSRRSEQQLRAIRHGVNNPEDLTRSGIDRALRWQEGSTTLCLRGQSPIALPDEPEPTIDRKATQSGDSDQELAVRTLRNAIMTLRRRRQGDVDVEISDEELAEIIALASALQYERMEKRRERE